MVFRGSINNNVVDVFLYVREQVGDDCESYWYPKVQISLIPQELEICDCFSNESDAWSHGKDTLEKMGFEEIN